MYNGSELKFFAAWRADVVGYTRSSSDIEREDKASVFRDTVRNSPTYQQLKKGLYYEDDKGDEIIFIVPVEHAHELIKLSKDVQSILVNYPDVKIRTGLHAGRGSAIIKDEKMVSVRGDIMIYSKRVMDVGSAGDILATDDYINTLQAITQEYKEYFHYAGKYPIKHGEYLRVWYFHSKELGNRHQPKRKRMVFITHMSSRNRRLAITLMAFATIGLIISGQSLFINMTKPPVIDDISESLKNKITDTVYTNFDSNENSVEKMMKTQIDKMQIKDPELVNILSTDTLSNLNGLVENITGSNKDIKYAWVSHTKDYPAPCLLAAYKPYDKSFNNATDGFPTRPWCIGMNDHETYLTETYYATGPKDFVNTLVTDIVVKLPNGKAEVIGYFGEALEWNSIIPEIIRNNESMRVVVVDHLGFIAADCTSHGCKDLSRTENNKEIDVPIPVNSTDILSFGSFVEKRSLTPDRTRGSNIEMLDGWTIYLLAEKTPVEFATRLFLFLAILAAFVVLVYLYLIPRHWLDDTDELRRIKK